MGHSSWRFAFFGACRCWCLCRFGDSDFQNIGRHQQKPTTRCTKPAHAPEKNPATTQKWGHSSWTVVFPRCLSMFPPLPLCFFLCSCRFGGSDFTKHWEAAQTTKKHCQHFIKPNLLLMLLHLLLTSPWWISSAVASWLRVDHTCLYFKKPVQ